MQGQNVKGIVTVISASTLWAIAANVSSSLFQAGVTPFELAGVSAIVATMGKTVHLPRCCCKLFQAPA
jgi:DME family drug/metabolite transporter